MEDIGRDRVGSATGAVRTMVDMGVVIKMARAKTERDT